MVNPVQSIQWASAIMYQEIRGQIPKKNLVYGTLCWSLIITLPYLCPLQIRLQHMADARVDLNPMPQSALFPVRDFGFDLWSVKFSCELCKKGKHSLFILPGIKNDLAYILWYCFNFFDYKFFYDLSPLDT
jgi:hypothetical protein